MLAAVGVLLNIARTPGARLRVVSGDRNQPRVVVAAGGTAGHVVPALAVADALRDKGALVTFAGTAERAEATLVPEAGYEIDYLRVRGIDRSNPLRAAGALALAARAVPAARGILRDARGRCGPRRRRLCGGAGRDRGGAPWPAARDDRSRPPPGPRQPPARAPRAPGLPGLRDPGARGRALPRDGKAGPAGDRRSRPRVRAPQLRPRRRRALPPRLRRQPGRPLDQHRRARRPARARPRIPCPSRDRDARSRDGRGARRRSGRRGALHRPRVPEEPR